MNDGIGRLRILIVGAGIGGLSAALSLHAAGLADVTLLEASAALSPVGAGLNVQPAAVRELTELGLASELARNAVATGTLEFHHRRGGLIWAEARGMDAGYRWPQYSIHRGCLQELLLAAVEERLGNDVIRLGRPVNRVSDDGKRVTAVCGTGESFEADLLIGADGVDSVVRAHLYPHEGPAIGNGITMWRGLSRGLAYRDGRTMLVIGCNSTEKAVVYPITAPDPAGLCTINWVVESHTPGGEVPEVISPAVVTKLLAGWNHAEIDLRRMIEDCEEITTFPMIDRNPLPSWTRGRTVLIGDAAHPMYPTGSNGASQAVIDARVLAYYLAILPVDEALWAFDALRRPETSGLLAAHRRLEPDQLLYRVETLAPEGFEDIASVLSRAELDDIAATGRRVTGLSVQEINTMRSWSVSVG